MTQRIHNLSKWAFLAEGNAMNFPNPKRRTVILEVNVPSPLLLYVLQNKADVEGNPEKVLDLASGRWEQKRDGVNIALDAYAKDVKAQGRYATFLCACRPGRDRIEFGVDGAFELLAVDGDLYIWTNDSDRRETRIEDPLVFTQIANRRARNPQLELMMYQAKRNQELRMQEMQAEMEARMRAQIEGLERKYVERADKRTSLKPTPKVEHAANLATPSGGSPSPKAGEAGQGAGEGEGVPSGEEVSSAAGKSRGAPKKAP